MIYLDNAATTKVGEKVAEKMKQSLEVFGNPGSTHSAGREALHLVQNARKQVASLINADPEQVIFTSGGSESNNMVINGVRGDGDILVSNVEHHSILRAAENKQREGVAIIKCLVDSDCVCDLSDLRSKLDGDNNIRLVSVMFVNNEVGAINDVNSIAKMCHDRGILFHTDCVQALGGVEVDVRDIDCDFASFSSHKIHGPKGVGALYVKDKNTINPIIYGGESQEFGMRGGTENVQSIVGFGEACEIVRLNLLQDTQYVLGLKNEFEHTLTEECRKHRIINSLHINSPIPCSPKILNLRFDGVDGETLMVMLDSKQIYVSAGSACQAHESAPSHVLVGMGLTDKQARESIRLSFSTLNDINEVIYVAREISQSVAMLMSGLR